MLEMVRTRAPWAAAFRHTATFHRVEVTVTYGLNVPEHELRQRRGVDAITDQRLLASLLELSSTDLRAVEARFVQRLSRSGTESIVALVTDPDGGIWGRRLIDCPVEILEIRAPATSWKRGSTIAHAWAGYGPRVVRVDREPDTFALTEASHYGIGLVHGAEERPMLEPAPFRPKRWTAARWQLAEVIYQQYLDFKD